MNELVAVKYYNYVEKDFFFNNIRVKSSPKSTIFCFMPKNYVYKTVFRVNCTFRL